MTPTDPEPEAQVARFLVGMFRNRFFGKGLFVRKRIYRASNERGNKLQTSVHAEPLLHAFSKEEQAETKLFCVLTSFDRTRSVIFVLFGLKTKPDFQRKFSGL